jgi:hypothetical protein
MQVSKGYGIRMEIEIKSEMRGNGEFLGDCGID